MKKRIYIGIAFAIICIILWFVYWGNVINKACIQHVEGDSTYAVWRDNHHELNHKNVYNELIAQQIDYPEIVLAQAILETGNYKSYSCTTRNNLFGLRRRDGSYMEFGHWTQSVAAYKKYIQKYQEVPNDYYKFLDDLGYAEDSIYVVRVEQIVKTIVAKSIQ